VSVSPSKLKMLASCPRWVRDDKERDESMKEAAEEGTRLHGFCEELIRNHPAEKWESMACAVAGDDADLIMESLRTVRDYVIGAGLNAAPARCILDDKPYRIALPDPGTYASEATVCTELNGTQRMDFVAVTRDGATAIVADFKFVRGEPDARLQLNAYALSIMEILPEVQSVLALAPAPRTIAPDYSATVSRRDIPAVRGEIEGIIARAQDKFTPGHPCEFCCTCAGNGRCPWQVATLREIAADPAVAIVTKDQLLDPATPYDRGRRRMLIQWLEKFVDAAKDQDKMWALANPDTPLPGWTVTMTAGRKCIDKDRRLEACKLAEAHLQVAGDDLLGCTAVDPAALSALVSMRDGLSKAQADAKVQQALAPVMVRGAAYPVMRREAKSKQLT